MKKKFKIFKFLIALLMIVSIIPSFAAFTSVEGGFFVTKSEFDSALADFNSRLTTFEAGINSKIDSQVTSYLERNGIWKAKDQVIEGTGSWGANGEVVLGVGMINKSYYDHYNYYYQYGNPTATRYCYDLPQGVTVNKCRYGTVIQKITKTGLMNIIGEFGEGGTPKDFGAGRTSNVYDDAGACNLQFTWYIEKIHNSVATVEWSENWTWNMNQCTGLWQIWNRVYAYIPLLPISAYFFVETGDKIDCGAIGYAYIENAMFGTYSSGTARLKVNMKIKSAKVY